MNLDQARFNMIEQQIRPWDLTDTRVLDLLFNVRRELFVPSAYQGLAFADTQIPLGHGGAMLTPNLEARALQALAMNAESKLRVLEVGTGSGFMAALLAANAEHVWSVEIVPELAATARENLARAGVTNVTVSVGNGLDGLQAQGPFDVIMVSGAVAAIPQELLAQLKLGGRLFAVVGHAPAMQAQLVTRSSDTHWLNRPLFETVAECLQAPAQPGFVF
jgi:protein-L-isoaspartate(D-aspartate) O-methyltransferase